MPINLGHPNPTIDELSSDISMLLAGDLRLVRMDESAKYEGRSVVQFSYETKVGQVEYWVDVERGAVPLRRRAFIPSNGNILVLCNDDLIFANELAWLPRRVTHCIENMRIAHTLTIESVSLGTEPDPSRFTIGLETPRAALDPVKGISYDARKEWNLRRLSSPGARDNKPISTAVAPSSAVPMPGEREGWPAQTYLFAVATAVLAILVIVRIAGRGRRQ
jgi:hypothetical protein